MCPRCSILFYFIFTRNLFCFEIFSEEVNSSIFLMKDKKQKQKQKMSSSKFETDL